jgi:hypothetical protein
MTNPKRPESVPKNAVWVEDENEWQTGSIMRGNQAPRGDCKAWREDGSLAATYTLDKDGVVQGVLTRFHPDGSVASRGEWKDGSRFGNFMFQRSDSDSPEPYEGGEKTWRYEFYSEANWSEEKERWFAKDGTPVTSDGRPLATAFDMDAVMQISSPEGFLEKHGAACFQAFYGKEPAPPKAQKSLIDFWGPEAIPFIHTSAHLIEFGAQEVREFKGNCWESLIAYPWLNMHEELSAIFMGAECVGSLGDSDQIYLTLFHRNRPKPRSNAAYFWTHELYYLDHVITLDLDSFAFQCALSASHEAERLSDEQAKIAWLRLKQKVHLPWGLDSGVDLLYQDSSDAHEQKQSAFGTDLDDDGYVRSYYWRAQWLIRLLVVDEERDWDDIKEAFDDSRNKAWSAEDFSAIIATGQLVPPTALYALWRLFWTKDARLASALKAYEKHPARVVRDLVDLIKRFEQGLKGITGIADVGATRERFLALKLFKG